MLILVDRSYILIHNGTFSLIICSTYIYINYMYIRNFSLSQVHQCQSIVNDHHKNIDHFFNTSTKTSIPELGLHK